MQVDTQVNATLVTSIIEKEIAMAHHNLRFDSRYKQKKQILFKRFCLLLVMAGLLFLAWRISDFAGISEASNTYTSAKSSKSVQADIKAEEDAAEQAKLNELKQDIADYLEDYDGTYGVYYQNLTSGKEFGINAEDEFTAASTIKVPLNLYLYKKIKSGTVNPESKLTYTSGDYEGGTGILQYKRVGTRYTIAELSRLSIEYSDNVATNMLIRYLGIYNFKNYMRQVGGKAVADYKNISSPKDMGLYLKLVYQFSKTGGEPGNVLMDNLLNTKFNDRIPALLPNSVQIAHKIGNEEQVVNDVGIVFAGRTYIISLMSKNINETEATKVLAHISKMTYDAVGKNNKL